MITMDHRRNLDDERAMNLSFRWGKQLERARFRSSTASVET